MQFDDFILSKKVQLTTGYYSVLTMSETSAGATVFAARKTKLAREACLLVYTRWIPHYGTPEILSSDLDPALIGQVATFMCKASGIKDRINTTLGLHCPLAEHRNKYLAEAIRCAEAKGDLTSPEALLMVIANAQIRATQIVKTDGATVFERLHGEPAPTTRNLLAADKMTADQMIAAIAHAKPEDAAFMKQIKHRCDELLAWHNIKADQRSRYNVANNLAKQANLHRTDFGWTVGQKVAIGEKVHTILDIPKIADNVPVVAQVADEDGTASIVLLSRLRPMSVDKPENTSTSILPEIALTLQLSDLIFYEALDASGLLAGVILSIENEDITVHVHQPKQGVKTWLPRWEDPSHLNKIIRKKACPSGCRPFTDAIIASQVVSKGTFSGTNMGLTDDTIYHLLTLGFEVTLRPDDPSSLEEASLCLSTTGGEDSEFSVCLYGGAVSIPMI
jgi:hypothetical protein